MTTPEQQAREMLERMGIQSAYQRMSAGELVELANLIDEHDALKAELAAIKGAGEPVAWAVKTNGRYNNMFLGNEQTAVERMCRLNFNFPGDKRAVVPLYTRPCAPLTDEQIVLIRDEHLPSQGDSFDCVAFARAVIEAYIKGAKG